MTTLRTRLSQAAWDAAAANGTPDDILDAVLTVLGSPTDADVERVARGMFGGDDGRPPYLEARPDAWKAYVYQARAAIRALVGEDGV